MIEPSAFVYHAHSPCPSRVDDYAFRPEHTTPMYRHVGAFGVPVDGFETTDPPSGMGIAPAETIVLWLNLVASMGPDELTNFEARTFATWDRASLNAVRIAIDRRRKELAR